MVVAIILILVLVGTIAFHFMSPWWWTPIASNWDFIDITINITIAVTGIVFIAVLLFMAYCVYRYNSKRGKRAEYEPENTKLEVWLTVGTAVGVAVMLTPGLFVWDDFITVPEGAAEFEVIGKQWDWTYRFPGKDGKLGTSDVRNINDDNPFGLNLDDPNGQDDVLIDDTEVHLPLGQSIKVLLRSIDVLHDFYVPEFRAKMDLVPGVVTYFWFTPTRTGTFDILCFELCGIGHYAMRGSVVGEEESDLQAWLEEQPTFAEELARAGNGTADGLIVRDSEAESTKRGSEPSVVGLMTPDKSEAKRVF